MGPTSTSRPFTRPREARDGTQGPEDSRRHQPRPLEPARWRGLGDVHREHLAQHIAASGQLQGCHRAGVPHGGGHPGAITVSLWRAVSSPSQRRFLRTNFICTLSARSYLLRRSFIRRSTSSRLSSPLLIASLRMPLVKPKMRIQRRLNARRRQRLDVSLRG